MKIGVICSSGGSVMSECVAACGGKHSFFLVTDRECAGENVADAHGIPRHRSLGRTNGEISRDALRWFDSQGGVDFIVLFFLRIVTAELTDLIPTFNIHPSLLPAYPGFNAIKRAQAEHARFLGATLHLATEAVDHGPIIAQACAPMPDTLPLAMKISFLQKTHLALSLIELMEGNSIDLDLARRHATLTGATSSTPFFNPALRSAEYCNHVAALFEREGHSGLLRGA